MLKHLEDIKDQVIVTFQVEIEFKKNRQSVIEESMNALRAPTKIAPPRLFSDAKKAKSLLNNIANAEKHVKALKERFQRALDNPSLNDPVYKICQRCFHKKDKITLLRETKGKRLIVPKSIPPLSLRLPSA